MTSEPIAIAVGRAGDKRVLQVGGDGKSNSSPIIMAPYVASTNATAPTQRWNLERVSGTGIPVFAYRIKNPATGKCLNSSGATPANKAPIILYTCNGTVSATNEIWWMDSDPFPDGVPFRNQRDKRCLDITDGSTANNAPVESYTCANSDTGWNQLFKTRTGAFDCTARDSDWQITANLCANSPTASAGVIANWFNVASTIAYRNPSQYVLSNEVRSRVVATVINAQAAYSGDVQIGWRALRATTSTGGVSYNAYWQEYGSNVEEYHAISAVDPLGDPNGSAVADGNEHTYLMQNSTTAGQWDLFYDFNYVATTRRQTGTRINFVDAGVQARYVDALTQAQPFQFRTQLLDPTGFWHKPNTADTALGNNKECGIFPIWEDFSNGAGNNQPPWCLTTARTIIGAGTEVDLLKVSKPTSPVSLAQEPPAPVTTGGLVNGVDQAALSRCIADDPAACLKKIPGLQQCVQRHLLCHAAPTAGVRETPAGTRPHINADQAGRAALQLVAVDRPGEAAATIAKPDVVRTTLDGATHQNLPGADITGHRQDEPVYVVTGTGPVHSWSAASMAAYSRWTAVVSADSGDLLYARLDGKR